MICVPCIILELLVFGRNRVLLVRVGLLHVTRNISYASMSEEAEHSIPVIAATKIKKKKLNNYEMKYYQTAL